MKIGQDIVKNLGMGTWYLGEGNNIRSDQEINALQYGINRGINVIDTAEMYGDGAAELLVGRAITQYDRSSLFLISKFYPWHADKDNMKASLTASLQRLGTDYLDLYLLHWPGDTPIEETLLALHGLQQDGLIKQFGVSNFDVRDLNAASANHYFEDISANEILYNVATRGTEYDLLPYHRTHNIATIAYSPFGSGNGNEIQIPSIISQLAHDKTVTIHQLILSWILRQTNILAIPKASSVDHIQNNIDAMNIEWSPDELAIIDTAFPAPSHKEPLKVI